MQPEGCKRACPGKLVEDTREIKEAITQVKELGDEWYTNYYISDGVAEVWISKQQLMMYRHKNVVFIFRKRNNFSLVYYFASSFDGLVSSIKGLLDSTTETLSVDVLQRNGTECAVGKAFLEAGFDKRVRLHRMKFNAQIYESCNFDDICCADVDDAESVYDMLHSEFDELCEQIPDLDEIKNAIRNKEIMVVKDNSMLIAFLWIERIRKIAMIRYWLTHSEYRSRNFGAKLMQYVLSANKDATQVLVWVREDNIRAIKKYEKMGFINDILVDDVYCLVR